MKIVRQMVRSILTTNLSSKEIARALSTSKTTVSRYRHIATERGYRWEDLQDLSEDVFDAMFNKATNRLTRKRLPDLAYVREELQKPGVTLSLLWEEYRLSSPEDALSYSQFTEHFRRHAKSVDRTMRQRHVPGERVFVDFSGRRPVYVRPDTGEVVPVELFVSTCGASNYTYAVGLPSQSLPDWIDAHVRMFEFYGGAPKILVPDNLRSAVTRTGPNLLLNRTYEDLAEHYKVVILPARPYKPRDKPKVEGTVLLVQRWILARLRNRTFFSLAELNAAIAELVHAFNDRPFKRLPGSRASRFAELDQPLLQALPADPYELAEWSGPVLVDSGYHVLVRQHWYSVPHRLVGERVEARVTVRSVEFFHLGHRVACHLRSDAKGDLTTQPEHAPEAHRAYAERTPERYEAWAQTVGPATLQVVRRQFEGRPPALGLPACDTLRRLARDHGTEALESAAARAIEIQSPTLKSVRSLLSTGRFRRQRQEEHQGTLPLHHNVRGRATTLRRRRNSHASSSTNVAATRVAAPACDGRGTETPTQQSVSAGVGVRRAVGHVGAGGSGAA